MYNVTGEKQTEVKIKFYDYYNPEISKYKYIRLFKYNSFNSEAYEKIFLTKGKNFKHNIIILAHKYIKKKGYEKRIKDKAYYCDYLYIYKNDELRDFPPYNAVSIII